MKALDKDIWDVLFAVEAEFARAREKHGDNYGIPDFGYDAPDRFAYYRVPRAASAQEACERHFKLGYGSWADILVEEVAEAIDATDEDNLIEELIQVAAVASGWVEAIQRRRSLAQERAETVPA